MRTVNEIIPAAIRGKHAAPEAPQTQTQPRAIDRGAARVVNSLFAELQCIFPGWKQAWPNDLALKAAKRSWIKGFMAAGINSLEQIRYGVEQCRRHGGDFAPSVGRFIGWCQPTPEMLGLPSVSAAYREACRLAHPSADRGCASQAIYHAACEAGLYELAHLPQDKSFALFERAYAVTVRMLLAGEPLREIPKALPASVSVSTPEVGRAALAALRGIRRGVA